jgi:hypothetical protein
MGLIGRFPSQYNIRYRKLFSNSHGSVSRTGIACGSEAFPGALLLDRIVEPIQEAVGKWFGHEAEDFKKFNQLFFGFRQCPDVPS